MQQKYHLEPNRGLLNDPNGVVFFKGEYYVFFQWNRYAKNHNYKEWGLFKSTDLLSWTFEGSALLPDQNYDKDGVYSGSSYVINNKLYIFYTGNTKINGQRKVYQCLAITEDGKKYLKYGCILETPVGYTEHFRDPKVFQGKNGEYFMVIGSQTIDGKGAIALASSHDGVKWKSEKILAKTYDYEMIECPDLFKLDGKNILIFNPQVRDNETDTCGLSFSAYKIVNFNEETRQIDDDNLDRSNIMDYGFDFYAPQSFCDAKGRRIMFGWMSRMNTMQEQIFSENSKKIHCLTLPRQLYIKNEKLYQKIPEEFEQFKGKELVLKTMSSSEKRIVISKKTAFIKLVGSNLNDGIRLTLIEDRVEVFYNKIERAFYLIRHNWENNLAEQKKVFLSDLSAIEIWLDNSSIEIFLNEGEYVLSSRIYSNSATRTIRICEITKNINIECKELVGGIWK